MTTPPLGDLLGTEIYFISMTTGFFPHAVVVFYLKLDFLLRLLWMLLYRSFPFNSQAEKVFLSFQFSHTHTKNKAGDVGMILSDLRAVHL